MLRARKTINVGLFIFSAILVLTLLSVAAINFGMEIKQKEYSILLNDANDKNNLLENQNDYLQNEVLQRNN